MQVLGFIGASNLPGVVIPLLSQSVLIWQIAVGRVVLGKRLPAFQVWPLALRLHMGTAPSCRSSLFDVLADSVGHADALL